MKEAWFMLILWIVNDEDPKIELTKYLRFLMREENEGLACRRQEAERETWEEKPFNLAAMLQP